MKRLIFLLCLLVGLRSFSQIETTITVPTGTSPSTFQALLSLPDDYATSGTKVYPLLVFLHGSGESCPPLSNIYNSTTAGGVPYVIEHGLWDTTGYVNPKDGQKYKFIVLSPQSACNSWSTSGDELDSIISYMVKTYRVDVHREYATGLSSGGGGVTEQIAHLDAATETHTTQPRKNKLAACVPMSLATITPVQSWANVSTADSVHVWGFGDQNGDTYGSNTQLLMGFITTAKAGFSYFSGNPGTNGIAEFNTGHGPWAKFYNPSYTEVIGGVTMNIYQWMLQYTQGAPSTAPTANAGSNQTITLPTNSVSLSGSASTPGTGHTLTGYAWTKTAGPNTPTITSPASVNTTVTGLIQGTYTFLLTVTQNDAQTASNTVTIIVNAGTPVCIVGPNQTITLPTSSVTLDGSASTGTITSYAWTRISGPNTPTIVSPTTATTSITGLIQGTYIFQLSLNSGVSTAKDTVTVLPVPPTYNSPYILANAAQSITVNHANLTSNYILTGATLGAINWSKFKVPGGRTYKVLVMGSSYPTGAGASVDDSAYMGGYDTTGTFHHGHFEDLYHTQGVMDSLINWGIFGHNVYQIMPNGYVPPTDVSAKLSPSDTPWVHWNITAAILRHPDVIILSFPTNGYDVLTMPEVMTPFQIIHDSCVAHGILFFVTTTAPRTDAAYNTTQKRQNLKDVSDSLRNRFGAQAIDFYDGLTITGTYNPLYPSNAGDSIHMNDAGHRVMFEAIQATNVFQSLISSTATITTPNTQNTATATLPNGVNIFQVSVQDSHIQYYNALDTITVSVAGAPTANAGSNQTVTLPVTSCTLNGTGSTGTITSYSWTRISGPNVPTIVTPTTATTSVTGLTAGTYVFQLSLNGGVSTSTVSIFVVPAPGCSGRKYKIVPFSDGSMFIDDGQAGAPYYFSPGDTVLVTDSSSVNNYLTQWNIGNVHGTQGCPIVFMNDPALGRGVRIREATGQFTFFNCTYVELNGNGIPGTLGFQHNYDTSKTKLQPWNYATAGGASFAYAINGRSKNIHMHHIYTRHASVGFDIKEDGGCLDSLNKTGSPNDWIIDSIEIDHSTIISSWNEGMYIGNTSPDNGPNSYDVRPVICAPGDTTYPRPIRMGRVYVHDMYVDSTGRSGIQMVSGNGSSMEIAFNTVKHSGMNGDEGQGANITTGTYAWPYIHDNICSNSFTWNIASQGAGFTNHSMIWQNNTCDSAGYNNYYFGAATHQDGADSAMEPFLFRITTNTLTYPHQFYVATRQVDSLPALDSVQFAVKNNKLGIFKNNLNDFIQVQENSNIGTPGYNHFQINGNFICSNTKLDGVTPVLGVQNSDPGAATVNYSTNCAGASAPVVNQLTNTSIVLPVRFVSVVGVATPAPGQSISGYLWSYVSGPNVYSIGTPNASSTVISNLTVPYGQDQAVYVFQLQAIQSDGQIGSAQIQVTIQLSHFSRLRGEKFIFKNVP